MKATHMGTCQICGHFQKLPGGLLSKHGYTKRWGFFEGTCNGAHGKPFEISTDLIERAIASAQDHLKVVKEESAALKAGKHFENNQAWKQVYHPATWNKYLPSGYVWEKVTVSSEERKYNRADFGEGDGEGSYWRFYSLAAHEGAKREEVHADFGVKDLDAVRLTMNIRYAEGFLDKRAAQIREYIKWQQERVANWKPAELKPLAQEAAR